MVPFSEPEGVSPDVISLRSSQTSTLPHHHGFPAQDPSSASVSSHVSGVCGGSITGGTSVVKDISFWGGLALLICNTTGPGSVTLPLVSQQAGWLPTLIGFVLVGILSYLSSMFVCEAMTEIPGNDHFQANVEFSNLVLCFFGRRYQVLVQIVCFLALQTTNIASIAISAQLFDNLLIRIFHRTCGLQVYPSVALICVTEQLPAASPFSGVLIMSTGAFVALIMIVPLCLMNLSENIWLQIASCVLILLIMLQWIVTFFIHGIETSRVPAIGSNISQTFGSILFNFAFITAVPSWANAKQPQVSAHKTAGSAVVTMTCLFLLISILGGMAYDIPADSTLIQAINSSPDVTVLSQIAGYTFPIVALITSIPVNMIVVRYNLIQSGTCRKNWANVLSCGLPWIFALPGMTGSVLATVVDWSSLFLVSGANFVIPFVLYICSKRYKEKLKRLPMIENEQVQRMAREAMSPSEYGEQTTSEEEKVLGWRRLLFWFRSKRSSSATPERTIEVDKEKATSFVLRDPSGIDNIETEELKETDDAGLKTGNEVHEQDTAFSASTSPSKMHKNTPCPPAARAEAPIAPPFLGGHNYSIPGFISSLAPLSLSRTTLELLQGSRPDDNVEIVGGPGLRAEHDRLPEHCQELATLRSLRAVPRWIPISGLAVAWCSLTLLLIGIIATIMYVFSKALRSIFPGNSTSLSLFNFI
ncbi:hypothetical protein BGX28_008905 [Mortierella sp. GBA30]|nr:hypothetical protein BGX28_008905 [Mortierella sp. GBA30]